MQFPRLMTPRGVFPGRSSVLEILVDSDPFHGLLLVVLNSGLFHGLILTVLESQCIFHE